MKQLLRTTGLATTLLTTLLLPAPALALLAPGAPAPDFQAQAALTGQPFSFKLSEALKKGPVVLYFFPKAFTKGCTFEAQLFAKSIDEFAALGASVLGMSSDDIEVLKEFSVKECRNKFAVGADPDGAVIKAYDARLIMGMDISQRASYVITPDGKVLFVYSDMDPEQHVTRTLEALKAWKAGPAPATP